MDGKKNDRKENRRVKAKKEAAKAKKQMNRVKKDIATEESDDTSSQTPQSKAKISENTNEISENTNEINEFIEETEEEKRVPLVAGAPVQGEVEFESAEEAAERREFESLMQYADELHRARKEQESIVC